MLAPPQEPPKQLTSQAKSLGHVTSSQLDAAQSIVHVPPSQPPLHSAGQLPPDGVGSSGQLAPPPPVPVPVPLPPSPSSSSGV